MSRRIRAIDVPVRDGAVVITPAALACYSETCRIFVAVLDGCENADRRHRAGCRRQWMMTRSAIRRSQGYRTLVRRFPPDLLPVGLDLTLQE